MVCVAAFLSLGEAAQHPGNGTAYQQVLPSPLHCYVGIDHEGLPVRKKEEATSTFLGPTMNSETQLYIIIHLRPLERIKCIPYWFLLAHPILLTLSYWHKVTVF